MSNAPKSHNATMPAKPMTMIKKMRKFGIFTVEPIHHSIPAQQVGQFSKVHRNSPCLVFAGPFLADVGSSMHL
jgi:hypothetical protein